VTAPSMKYMTFRLPTVFAVYAYEVDSLSTSYADNAKTVGNLKVMYFIEGAVTQLKERKHIRDTRVPSRKISRRSVPASPRYL